jgi:hypothetical protein
VTGSACAAPCLSAGQLGRPVLLVEGAGCCRGAGARQARLLEDCRPLWPAERPHSATSQSLPVPALPCLALPALPGRAINEECFTFNECGAYRAFTAARKPVWGVVYCDATKVGSVPCMAASLPRCLAATLAPASRALPAN